MSRTRAAIVIAVLASTTIVARAAHRGARTDVDVTRLPQSIAAWTGHDERPLSDDTMQQLSADSMVNRSYTDGAGAPVGLYVAFYTQQEPRVSIHSPLHCLPGTGWEPLDVDNVRLDTGNARRLVVRKNNDRALVLYWYAVHGRMIADEYASKLWLLHDSVRFGRSDAALVRIVVPLGASVEAAQTRAAAFARDLLPYLSQLWG